MRALLRDKDEAGQQPQRHPSQCKAYEAQGASAQRPSPAGCVSYAAMSHGPSRCMALANEGLQLERQAVICDRVGGAPDIAADYARAAGELGDAAARCPLAPATAQKATQLAAAADRLAGAAASSARSVARAIALYKQAAARLLEAAAACPDSSPNKSALEQHASEISVRVIYLESLNGAPATIPLEDHIGDLVLQAPPDQTQEAPQAPPVSAPPEPPTPDPRSLPAASRSPASPRCSGRPGDPAEAASSSPPHAVPEKTDFLQEATRLERKARDLEAQGKPEEALEVFTDCLHLFAYVLKRDARMSNPKIKQMLRERMEELLTHAEVLKARKTLDI